MPIVDANGKKLSEKELNTLIKMMRGQLRSSVEYFNWMGDVDIDNANGAEKFRDVDLSKDEKGNIREEAIRFYTQAADEIEDKYKKLNDGDQVVHIEDLMKNEVAEVDKKFLVIGKHDDIYLKAFILRTSHDLDNEYTFDLLKKINGGDKTYKDVERIHEIVFMPVIKDFELSDNVLDGIEKIVDFDPLKDTVISMSSERKQNSESLKIADYDSTKEKAEKALEKYKAAKEDKNLTKKEVAQAKRDYDDALLKHNKYEFGLYSLNYTADLARVKSGDLMKKKSVTALELYEIMSDYNEALRLGQQQGGNIRGNNIAYGPGQNIPGVAPGFLPAILYKTLDKIANNINAIKKIEDKDLRKSQAVDLAGFVYHACISIHPFSDGNGRTCRMFADTVLQAFGLPPHIPYREEEELAGVGIEYSPSKDKRVIYEGVIRANEMVISDREKLAKLKEQTREMDRARQELQKKKELSVIDKDIEENKKYVDISDKVRGRFHDSAYYDRFADAILAKYEISKMLKESIEEKLPYLNMSGLSKSTREIIFAGAQVSTKTDKMAFDKGKEMLDCVNAYIKATAREYIKYKYADHTDDVSIEKNMKPMSEKDLGKLGFIEDVLGEDTYNDLKKGILGDRISAVNQQKVMEGNNQIVL